MSDAVIRGVSLQLDISPSLPHVKGNRVQLQQVILNLLLNALDAVTSRSGVPAHCQAGDAHAGAGRRCRIGVRQRSGPACVR